ncbi:hypothetical protein HNR46_000003 [Haloferula luteola]|uniref:Transposase n=1 Tax=Haloferula luteola TaxID=595692 RepID=A0A840UVG8_9BACT|nr:hypothetical protein [Haloferula luteola]MBB5349782.1 hypothetical protein [Haloferula luteola]
MLDKLSEPYPGALIVFEVGMHRPWTSHHFEALGHRVLVANPRKVRAIWQNDRKCDGRGSVAPTRILSFPAASEEGKSPVGFVPTFAPDSGI